MKKPMAQWWLPALDRLGKKHPLRQQLLRADHLADTPPARLPALTQWFDVGTATIPAGALLRQHFAGDAGDSVWMAAEPAWAFADINGVRLMACGSLEVTAKEAEALVSSLAPLFAEVGMQLLAATPTQWQLRAAPDTALPELTAPEQALGEDLFLHLPKGDAGKRWRILFNDVQMALHEHPVNLARKRHGETVVNTVWPWGAGKLPATVTANVAGVVSDEPLLVALAARAGIERKPLSPDAVALAAAGWLVDLQGLAAGEFERDWWPSMQTAMARRALHIVFGSGECWAWRPWHRWRIWRRPAR